ncbi:MAG: proline racemase family protein [Desulfobacteraceae bacterium]|nr:proline racemase family protein [Desulfobacteraceae bacterium]
MDHFIPSGKYQKIATIDAHTAGEPFRIITSGVPEPKGITILEKRRDAKANLDHIRKILMFEPRGHADMYGCFITEPATPGADFGILFIHNEGFSTMCGHGIIAVTTIAVETGFIEPNPLDPEIKIDTPAGLVRARANMGPHGVESVSFKNVASFAPDIDAIVTVPDLGDVRYDLGFGGAFYAFVNAKDLNLECTPDYFPLLIEKGRKIKNAVMAQKKIIHPYEEDLGFLYGTIFVDYPDIEGVHSRHCCVFAEGEVDRSPTGTGVSARLAILNQKNKIKKNECIQINSIINSSFTGEITDYAKAGEHSAVIPKITGSAYITGKHEFLIDPSDPLNQGFILR